MDGELGAQLAIHEICKKVEVKKVVYCDLGTDSVYFAANSCAISGVLTA
jgi:hypothetical protein